MDRMFKGRCGCGEIELEFSGEPRNAVFCYCTDCQRDTGSDKWFGLWVSTDRLVFTKGRTANVYAAGQHGETGAQEILQVLRHNVMQ